jgi:cyclopropane-fatty-acyl-phospholipid synthase
MIEAPPDVTASGAIAGLVDLPPGDLPFAIELEGRPVLRPHGGESALGTLQIASRAALARLLSASDIGALARAYVEGDWDFTGDLEGMLRAVETIAASEPRKLAPLLALAQRFAQSAGAAADLDPDPVPVPQPYVRSGDGASATERARQAISYHYDLPVEYWRLWLDDNLLYTCGYHQRIDDDVHTAQRQKLARVAAKVRLTPGDRVLDLGCGWGGFAVHAGRSGAQVVGLTLSESQAVEARRRIAEAGLASACRVEICDVCNYHPDAPFDAAVAVGLIEHLGAPLLPAFFERAYAALRPGALFLVQGIALPEGAEFGAAVASFIDDYIFPEAKLESIGTTLLHAERAGFEVYDVESLREHYVLTLRQWLGRLEHNAAAAQAIVGQPRYRAYRAYMAGFANEFRKGRLNVYQTVLQKPGASSRRPLARGDLSTSG